MKDIWDSIESKLQEIAPEIVKGLNGGITDTDVKKLKKMIGAKLPDDFVAFYHVHNGQDSDSPGMIDAEELLSFERIRDELNIWRDLLDSNTFMDDDCKPFTSYPDKGIKNNWYNALWIPITYDGSGNHYCLDLDPAEYGNYGQIIRMWHDDAVRSLEADSFKEWVTNYKDKLESGDLVYSEDFFGIISKDEV